MIKVTALNKYYNKGKGNELHVINNTSVELPDTGLICILGESGSGKTTLMNTISGLDDFVGGTIQVDDVTIRKFGSKEQENVRNEKFGYIFQNYYLLQDRTVEYNIRLSLNMYDLTEEEKDARIDYVLKAVDMSRFKKRLVTQLSGGQQQRIAIARALAKTPKVIFADEPTGNLDEANTMRIMGILKKVSKDCLVVVVTHERSIADFFADRIIWIADGKIQKEQEKKSSTTYTYNDDNNIYLQEYEKCEYQNDKVTVETFSNEELPCIGIKLIYDNGKYYLISTGETAVEYLTQKDEKQVIDSKRPKLEMQDVDDLEYTLEPLKYAKTPRLSPKEIRRVAKSNLGSMGKKQIFLILSLIVMSVLVVLTVQDMMTLLNINKQEIVSTDSHYLKVTMEKNGMIQSAEQEKAIREVIDAVENSDIDMEMNVVPYVNLSYQYEGFWQLEDVSSELENFSIVTVDHLSQDDLICGRMPESAYEVVMDKWILENFISGENEISNVITNVKHFLNKKFSVAKSNACLTVVGICDSGQPNIYMEKLQAAGVSSYTESISGITAFAKAYEDYADITLAEDEVLIPEAQLEELREKYINTNYRELKRYQEEKEEMDEWGTNVQFGNRNKRKDFASDAQWLEEEKTKAEEKCGITYEEYLDLIEHPEKLQVTYEMPNHEEYKIAGTISEESGLDLIVSDAYFETLRDYLTVNYKRMLVYAQDKEAAKDFLETKLDSSLYDKLNIVVEDTYENQLKEYKEARNVKVDARMIITITIFVISMLILFFMMKANAVARMQDLGVYRLLGISKASIVSLFAYENFLLTCCTSLIGAVITTAVTKFISSIPSLEMQIIYPWYAFGGTLLFLYAVNIIIGVLPIMGILKLPPAQLAAKYDI